MCNVYIKIDNRETEGRKKSEYESGQFNADIFVAQKKKIAIIH